MYLGAAWYPEHWSEDRWAEDARLMREAGFNVCRIAEFAWSSLEPAEGHYEFGWLERAVALLQARQTRRAFRRQVPHYRLPVIQLRAPAQAITMNLRCASG